MELILQNVDSSFTNIIAYYQIDSNEKVLLSGENYTYTLPDDVYTLLTAQSNTIKFIVYNGENELTNITLNYLSDYSNIIDLQNCIDNNITELTVGENKNTVFVSKNNLVTIWNNIKSNVYNKTEIDTSLQNYYTKASTYSATQINSLLNNKVTAGTVYTKTEVDDLISQNDTYTKSEVDDLIANASSSIDTSNFYTKSEIDEMIGQIENGSY